MKRPPKVLTEAAQGFTFTRRTMVLGGIQAAVGAMLIGRMGWLAIAENERYTSLAESNRVQLLLVPPPRGWIIDRHGAPIAINRSDFRIDLIPDRLEDKDAAIAALKALLQLPDEEVERIREDLSRAAGYQPVEVASGLPYDRFAAVNLRLLDLPGVAPSRGYSRHYPAGAAVGHLVGYVGAASAADYEKERDPLLIFPGFKVGKEGLERVMDAGLRGKPGAKRAEVTARGRLVRELTTRPETPGRNLRLTIDAGLQEYAARRIGTNSGSAVVIDTTNGDILALASMPSYDPNSFSDGISRSEWAMLSEDDHLPLLNKALQALYPPGSTMKPVSALATLEAGIEPSEIVVCNGRVRVGNRYFNCLRRHGPVDMERAIAASCNVYFYTMGRRIGIDRIASVARRLGLGQEFDLPVASQRYGTVPDTAWKLRKYGEEWKVSDTLNASIGQGYVLTSPLQLAVMASRVASGLMLQPGLFARRPRTAAPLLDFPPEHLAVVRRGMAAVVNGAGGTAGRSRLPLPGIQMAGKTGTAQVRRISRGARGGANVEWKYRDHGLFVAFAPTDVPRYAAAVVIEHGMSGSGAAAPVARDIMTWLYDRDRAMRTLTAMEESWGGDIPTRMAAQAEAWRTAREGAPPLPLRTAPPAARPSSAPITPPPAPPAPAPTDTPVPVPRPPE